MIRPSEDEVASFIALKKSLVRTMEWTDRPSVKTPRWKQFESRCFLGSSVSDEVLFRAHYRPKGVRQRGASTIELPEIFYVSIWIRDDRVFAIDTHEGQVHKNAVIEGRSYSGMTITSTTHMHVWSVKGDDYAEPIEPPLVELKDIISIFCARVSLSLNGDVKHPLRGQSLSFF